jgi:hypothetical protein
MWMRPMTGRAPHSLYRTVGTENIVTSILDVHSRDIRQLLLRCELRPMEQVGT